MTRLPDWLQQLRKSEVVNTVLTDPRSTGSTLFGYTREIAVQAIGGGQACFDESWYDLSPHDRVLLYCYLNQIGHLEELTEAFGQIFATEIPENEPIVVDLGCGPFTGGLALAGILGAEASFDYIGMDSSRTMRDFGETLANAAAQTFSEHVPMVRRFWTDDLSKFEWPFAPGWRPVIVIASYLLASRTLDVLTLVDEVGNFLNTLGGGEVTVLYTNSDRNEPNRNYPKFRASLLEWGFNEIDYDHGRLRPQRTRKDRRLRYALLYRSPQTTLAL